MRRFVVFFVVFAIAWPVLAQDSPGPIARVFWVTPKLGMEQQFIDGYKEHLAWHREQNDSWAWDTWTYDSGDRLGQYVIRTGGHHWKDFDTHADMARADEENYLATTHPYVQSVSSRYTQTHFDLSMLPEAGEEFPLIRVTEYRVHANRIPDFLHAFTKYKAAAEKTERPTHYVLIETVAGGPEASFATVGLHKSYEGLKPLEQTVGEMMQEVYGPAEAQSLFEMFFGSVASMETNILRYVPELSYEPAAQTSAR